MLKFTFCISDISEILEMQLNLVSTFFGFCSLSRRALFRDKSCIREILRVSTLNVLTACKVLEMCIPSASGESGMRPLQSEKALSLSLSFFATLLAWEKGKAARWQKRREDVALVREVRERCEKINELLWMHFTRVPCIPSGALNAIRGASQERKNAIWMQTILRDVWMARSKEYENGRPNRRSKS